MLSLRSHTHTLYKQTARQVAVTPVQVCCCELCPHNTARFYFLSSLLFQNAYRLYYFSCGCKKVFRCLLSSQSESSLFSLEMCPLCYGCFLSKESKISINAVFHGDVYLYLCMGTKRSRQPWYLWARWS